MLKSWVFLITPIIYIGMSKNIYNLLRNILNYLNIKKIL